MTDIYDMFTVPLVKYRIANWKENKQRILEALPKLSQEHLDQGVDCLLYTSPSPRDATLSRMPSSA